MSMRISWRTYRIGRYRDGQACLDSIQQIRQHCNLPIAAYNVSGEYAMIKAAAHQGWIDERRIVMRDR